jgi:hypothetical protein
MRALPLLLIATLSAAVEAVRPPLPHWSTDPVMAPWAQAPLSVQGRVVPIPPVSGDAADGLRHLLHAVGGTSGTDQRVQVLLERPGAVLVRWQPLTADEIAIVQTATGRVPIEVPFAARAPLPAGADPLAHCAWLIHDRATAAPSPELTQFFDLVFSHQGSVAIADAGLTPLPVPWLAPCRAAVGLLATRQAELPAWGEPRVELDPLLPTWTPAPVSEPVHSEGSDTLKNIMTACGELLHQQHA